MQYKCPKCQKELTWESKNPHKPFCSEPCKNNDLIAWANEENRVPGNQEWDDVLTSDIEAAEFQADKLF